MSSKNSNLSWENYVIIGKIGSGAFSTVYKAQHRTTKKFVAIKAIKREKLSKKQQINLKLEQSILKSLDHSNIVQLYEIMKTEKHIYLIMEFCAGGDLHRYLRRKRVLSEETAVHFMRQIAEGLKIMRKHNLIHRDLKPQNLLLSEEGDQAFIKIADFGLARYIDPEDMAATLCGSPTYMAPEVLSCQPYGPKADLWSVGAVLYEMVTGAPPYRASNHLELLRRIHAGKASFPRGIIVSQNCKDLLHEGLLKPDPLERIDFEVFFVHPFLTAPVVRAEGVVAIPLPLLDDAQRHVMGDLNGLELDSGDYGTESGDYERGNGSEFGASGVHALSGAHERSQEERPIAPTTRERRNSLDEAVLAPASTPAIDPGPPIPADAVYSPTEDFDFAEWERQAKLRIAQMNAIIASASSVVSPQRQAEPSPSPVGPALSAPAPLPPVEVNGVAPSTSGASTPSGRAREFRDPSKASSSEPADERSSRASTKPPLASGKTSEQVALLDLGKLHSLLEDTSLHSINRRNNGGVVIEDDAVLRSLLSMSNRETSRILDDARTIVTQVQKTHDPATSEYGYVIKDYLELFEESVLLRKQINGFTAAIQGPLLQRMKRLSSATNH